MKASGVARQQRVEKLSPSEEQKGKEQLPEKIPEAV
jgi:hypothetical protein